MTELSTALLNLTFAIHYAFVLLVIGGPFVGLFDSVRGLDAPFWRTRYPIMISLTITTGIAPLLFAQVSYGSSFYQSFINLHPWPLIFLAGLTVFFYVSYLPRKVKERRFLLLVIGVLQIALLVGAVSFLNALFQGYTHPDGQLEQFWSGEAPGPVLTFVALQFALGIGTTAIYLAIERRSPWLACAIPLTVAGVMTYARHQLRVDARNDRDSYGLLTDLDPAFYLFVACLVAVLASLGYAGRIVIRARRERYGTAG